MINLCWCDTASSQIYPCFTGLEAIVFSALQLAPPELDSVPLHDTAESHVHIPVCVYCGCWTIKTSRLAGTSGDFTVKPVESRALDWVVQGPIKPRLEYF